jgi:hypothetical protein
MKQNQRAGEKSFYETPQRRDVSSIIAIFLRNF